MPPFPGSWQQNSEHAAAASIGRYRNTAFLLFNNGFHNGQAKAAAANLTRTGFIHTIKTLKYAFLAFLRDSNSRILYL